MTFNSSLACSDTINISIQSFQTIDMQFYCNFVLLQWYDTDKKCSMDITLFDFAKFALTRDDPKALILPCSLYLRMAKKIRPWRSPFVNTQHSTRKKVSMIRNYHNRTLQTNPWRHEEVPQNTNIHKTPRI